MLVYVCLLVHWVRCVFRVLVESVVSSLSLVRRVPCVSCHVLCFVGVCVCVCVCVSVRVCVCLRVSCLYVSVCWAVVTRVCWVRCIFLWCGVYCVFCGYRSCQLGGRCALTAGWLQSEPIAIKRVARIKKVPYVAGLNSSTFTSWRSSVCRGSHG